MDDKEYFSFHNWPGLVLKHSEQGYAELEMPMLKEYLNRGGRLHGGFLYTLADMTAGTAVMSYGHRTTTVSGSMDYLRPGIGVEMLVDVEETYHGLGLHPPVAVGIDISGVEICLVGHRSIGIDAFYRSLCHPLDDGLHLCQHSGVSEYEGRLVQQPRALDVVPVAFEMSGTPCPVHLEEEVEMPCGGIEDAVAENVDEVAQCGFHTVGGAVHLLQTTEEVGIGLDDVEMSVLRFRKVCIDLRKANVGQGLPVA